MFYVYLLASKPYGPLCVGLIHPVAQDENAFNAEDAKGREARANSANAYRPSALKRHW